VTDDRLGGDPAEVHRTPIMELRPGDCVRLPIIGEGGELCWSRPVTITSVRLIDTGLAQVNWVPAADESEFEAHLMLIGAGFTAGALRVGPGR
jgi:hypothetical protein